MIKETNKTLNSSFLPELVMKYSLKLANAWLVQYRSLVFYIV